MTIRKLTTILIVDDVDLLLAFWTKLGFAIVTTVPHDTRTGFAILKGGDVELMLQSRASLADDLPAVAQRNPASLLYADVTSLADVAATIQSARVLVANRTTFYGATESWVETAGGSIVGFAEH